MFLAEKGLEAESVFTDMSTGAHKTPEFLARNPSGKLPVLELDDGTCIAESVAICRYLEAVCPEPNLFGATPVELGTIEARNRQIELELLSAIGTSWVNGPVVAKIAAGRFTQIPEAKERSDAMVRDYYERLDGELAAAPYIAGERFTVADITALIAIDFASELVDLKPDARHTALWAWHERVSARPSAAA